MERRRRFSYLVFQILLVLFLLTLLVLQSVNGEPKEDKQALLDFIKNVGEGKRDINWENSTSACEKWTGVTCSADRSRIVSLRLPGVGFNGQIPPNTLSRLTALQILSLRSNGFNGPFPSDFVNLTSLTGLHLQLNSLSGPIPKDFSSWKKLTVLDLSFNSFNGSIPSSISNLTQLTALNLSNNSFSGEILYLELPKLQFLDLSNNKLQGSIPKSLLRFSNSSFSGNNLTRVSPAVLAPPPVLVPQPLPPAAVVPSKTKKLNQSAVLGIIVGFIASLSAAFSVLLLLYCSRRKDDFKVSGKAGKGDRSPEKAVTANQDVNNRLVFFERCTYAFDLEDLLRASAEVLGKGSYGTAYKAVLEDATTVVVKRLKEVGVGKKEFEQQMEMVGRLQHDNMVDLRAYYYSKDEKLMVYDYYMLGSVHSMLHGMKQESLDWETRLKVAIGAARGIAYIHSESNGKLAHGNIKSSNVFLNNDNYGCVSDIGLTPLMTAVLPVSRTAGYRAPEVVDTRKVSQASDVYSFGVLLLELLTGRSPIQITGVGDQVIHLVRWVQSVVREEWTAEVFDVELMRYPGIEEEMVELLQIAMSCVVRMPEQRPKMTDVLRRIEEVRRLDTDNRPSTEASDHQNATTPPVQQETAGTIYSLVSSHYP